MTVERARTTVTLADDLRRRDPTAAGEDTGVPDPFGLSWKMQREIAVQIRDLSLELAEHLFGVAGLRDLATGAQQDQKTPALAHSP